MKRSYFVGGALLCVLAAFAPAAGPPPSTGPATFTWTNPLSPNVRDPQIIVVDGRYVMAATSSPFFEQLGESPGVKLWTSRDLTHWDSGTVVIPHSTTAWYRKRYWAPELYHSPDDGKFYLTFNCPRGGDDAKTPQAVCLAVADKPLGPYQVLTETAPLCEGNDATIFRDDDGKTYLFRSGLNATEVDLPHAKIIGQSFVVLAKPPVAATGPWDGQSRGAPAVGLEGPCVIKIGKTYYCFYSSWGRGYEIGYATAQSVRGPWTRYSGNPIYGAQEVDWAKRYKHTSDQAADIPWRQVGHGSIFIGPDGRYWTSAHGFRTGEKVLQPHLVFDPLNFHDGVFEKTAVSYTQQSVPIDPAVYPPKR